MPKGLKNFTFYLFMLIVFGGLMYGIVQLGDQFDTGIHKTFNLSSGKGMLTEGFQMFQNSVGEHAQTPIAMLLLQIVAILLIARIFGWIFNKMGQPSVIGEIVAGIVLGPSFFAQIAPDTFAFLFSPSSLGNIDMLSQMGLILFMFAIGMELDIVEVKKSLKETLLISHAGIIFPFFCGMLTAYWTYPQYASGQTSFLSYSLFIGIAMSITAFPVLARIIQERGLTKTRLGTLTLASAANGDVTAWCILAVVIAIAQSGTMVSAIYVILFTSLFVAFMFIFIRPFFNIIGNIYHNKEVVNKTIVGFMFFFLILSSYVTEMLGIHALFGAFMTGVVMPNNVKFRKILTEKVEDVALCLFLPLFFVSTGLKTHIGLINTTQDWIICLGFIVMAIIGKVIGSAVAARYTGESWYSSWTIGALMNTRGLMELIVLTIGYEMRILPQNIFVMLVIMTLVTTFMTTPLMSFIEFCFRKKKKTEQSPVEKKEYLRILLSFGRASSGSILLNVANQLFSKGKLKPDYTALHLTIGTDVNPIHVDNFEEISFEPIIQEAEKLNLDFTPRYEVASDAGTGIVNIVNNEGYDFLLVGAGISLSDVPADIEAVRNKELFYQKYFQKIKAPQSWFYPGDLLKDKTRTFIEQTYCTVGVFVNREFEIADKIIIILNKLHDTRLFEYAANLVEFNQAKITIFSLEDEINKDAHTLKAIEQFLRSYPETSIVKANELSEETFIDQNFMLVAYDSWNYISTEYKEALQNMPSTLIINGK